MGLMTKMRDNMHYVLIILVLAFVGTIVFDWGMNYLGSKGIGGPTGVIGKINGIDISYEDFFQRLQQEYMRIKQITGEEPDEIRMRNARNDVWENIVNQTLIEEEIKNNNIYLTNDEIVYIIKNNPPEFLRSNPQFLTDDKFDPQKYINALNNPNVNWSEIENYIRLTEPSNKMQNLIISTVRVTSKEIEKQIYLTFLKAKAEYVSLTPEDFADVEINISDNEINEYYNSHIEDYRENEKCKMKYVLFPVEITVQDTQAIIQEAQRLIERLKSGEDFAELANLYSQDPSAENGGDLGYFTRGDMIEPFEKAAFSAKEGELVGPVETDFGFHIIKVIDKKIDSVKASHILMKVEPSLETINKIRYQSDDFVEKANSEGFETAVQDGSLEVLETEYFMNTGFIPGIGMLFPATDFAFRGEIGDISETMKTDNEYYVFQLIEKIPERSKPLEEVKSLINDILIRNKKMDLAKQKISDTYNNITSGKSFEQAVEDNSLKIEETGTFGFSDYIPGIGNETKFTGRALNLNEGEVSAPIETPKGWYLIKLLEKTSDDTTGVSSEKDYISRGLYEQKVQITYAAWLQHLREKAEIEDYRKRYF